MYDYLKNKNVLYIEDELDVLRNISTLLRNFFKKIYVAADGESALATFKEKEIDILLVDIELPRMNGIELIKTIRKTHKDIPVVIISAYTKTDYLLESVELNLDKYIVKPLTSQKIHDLLERLNQDFTNENIKKITSDVVLNKRTSTVIFSDQEHSLTNKEFQFLSILAKKKMVHYDEVQALWGDQTPSQNAIRSCIKQLRKKLPEGFLKNRNGIGYYIEGAE